MDLPHLIIGAGVVLMLAAIVALSGFLFWGTGVLLVRRLRGRL